jgi:hypothetical protein
MGSAQRTHQLTLSFCGNKTGCDDNLLYSFLDSEDSGTLNMAQAMWWVGPEIMQQVMPMIHVDADEDWDDAGKTIPGWGAGSQDGFEACRKACGI